MDKYKNKLDAFGDYLDGIANNHPTGMMSGGTMDGLLEKYKAFKLFTDELQEKGGAFLADLLADVPEEDKGELNAALKKIGEEKVTEFLGRNNF